MINYSIYNLAHVMGVVLLFCSLGAMAYHAYLGGQKSDRGRRFVVLTHGLGMFFIFVAGFGMIARLGIHWPWPNWIILKLLVWLILGLIIVLYYRKRDLAAALWWATIILGCFAVYLGQMKPF